MRLSHVGLHSENTRPISQILRQCRVWRWEDKNDGAIMINWSSKLIEDISIARGEGNGEAQKAKFLQTALHLPPLSSYFFTTTHWTSVPDLPLSHCPTARRFRCPLSNVHPSHHCVYIYLYVSSTDSKPLNAVEKTSQGLAPSNGKCPLRTARKRTLSTGWIKVVE